MRKYIITVVEPDRVGILRDVTGAVKDAGGNLVDLRQVVLGGMFTLSCVAEFKTDRDILSALREAVRSSLRGGGAGVFAAECPEGLEKVDKRRGERYVAAVTGPDLPGRIFLITELFASRGVNVEDWRHDLTDRTNALTIGIITVPPECDVALLQKDLQERLNSSGAVCSIRHENIFRATNEVGPIGDLLGSRTPKQQG